MSLDFFESFADMKMSERAVKNGTVDFEFSIENECENENVNTNVSKKYNHIHGVNVIMKDGQYKGYNGFVYEYYPSMTSFSVDENVYMFGESGKKIGDELNGGVILDKVGSLLNVKLTDEVSCKDIFLERGCFARYVFFMEGDERKIGQILEIRDKEYVLVVMNFDLNTSCKGDLLFGVKKCFDKGVFFYGDKVTKNINDCEDEYYFVCKHQDVGGVDYYGRYGKLVSEVCDQYFVSTKRIVKVKESMTRSKGNRVKVQRGMYKNKEGEMLGVESAYLCVQIEALSKKITNHYVRLSNGNFEVRKIYPRDVFFVDLELLNGNYFQVDECYTDKYVGIEKCGLEFKKCIVRNNMVKNVMPGFTVTRESGSVEKTNDDDNKDIREYVCEPIESGEITDELQDELQDESVDDVDYKGPLEEGSVGNVFENVEGEMKETYRDIERSAFVQRSFSKDESDYLKMIEKCTNVVGIDIVDKYSLLDKASDFVKRVKYELKKNEIKDWCKSDIRYMIGCLVIYEILKSGYGSDFVKYIEDLYRVGYLKNTGIQKSMFLKKGGMGVYSEIDDKRYKDLLGSKRYTELHIGLMESCYKMLCDFYGFVEISIKKDDLTLIRVSDNKCCLKENYKFFLTSDEIANDINNNPRCGKVGTILWGSKSRVLLDKWKERLMSKYVDDKQAGYIYKFVSDNLDNAPNVLKMLRCSDKKDDKIKFRELERTFELFKKNLKKYLHNREEEIESKKKFLLNKRVTLDQKREKYNMKCE